MVMFIKKKWRSFVKYLACKLDFLNKTGKNNNENSHSIEKEKIIKENHIRK